MKRTLMLLGLACLTLSLLVGCDKSQETTGTDGNTDGSQPDAIALARTLRPILAKMLTLRRQFAGNWLAGITEKLESLRSG